MPDAMSPARRRPRRRMMAVAAIGLTAAAGVVGVTVLHRGGEAATIDAPGVQSAIVQQRLFVSVLSVAGAIATGPGGEVTAPFDGTIRSVRFVYGERVEPGQVLVVFDATDVNARRNEAEAAFLKSSQMAAEFADWDNGPEVSRARRAATLAESDLRDADRKVDETRTLLDRGLVPRNEYEAALRQRQIQDAGLAAARQDLGQALARGGAAPRRAAGLDLQNARGRLSDLDSQASAATVRAPIGGVMVRPPADKAEAAAAHAGQQMTRGQLIGAVASPDVLMVTFRLGETDANRVRQGQAVTVTGTGFPGMVLKGRVAAVAGEATPPSAGSPISTVAALARLDPLSPEQATAVRIGMTATVSIQVYANPSALVAPPAAIQGAAPATTVSVRAADGRIRRTAVRIGQVAPDGVEILSGLKAGEVIVWTPPPPVPTAAS